MGDLSEVWASSALSTEDAVKVLVIAKELRRLMTLRPLLLVASPYLAEEIWALLQDSFDVVLRFPGSLLPPKDHTHFHTQAKLMLLSLQKYNKIVYISPDSLVVSGADDLFKVATNAASPDSSVFVGKPSAHYAKRWGRERCEGEASSLFQDWAALDPKYCVRVELKKDILAINRSELRIARFVGDHPMEILCKDEQSEVHGYIEQELLRLWKDHLDHGVAQRLAKLETSSFNGLKSYLEQYSSSSTEPFDAEELSLSEVKSSIAIIGIGCRFPGANTLDEFWKLLLEGGDAIRGAPPGRWCPERCPTLSEDAQNSRGGFLACPVDAFDGKFFGVSPMEMGFMDPQQRLTLQVAWEALEHAGIDPTSLRQSYTGVFGGSWRTDYREALQTAGTGEAEFFRSYLGNSLGVITARISHTLGLTGPSVSTESGCSSSIVAVDLACKSLLRGETDLSLACGVNLLIHPFTGKTMNTVLATDGHCKTFAADADGFGRAEAVGVLVLKRYPDAVRDGDHVHGLIRGSAVVQEGASRSLGTPTKVCEALAMRMALDAARVEGKDVSYVETHGTGTPVGDPLEVAAVAAVYSEGREEPLTIGSVKTNIGHTESCSGIAGIVKVILSLQNEIIPPHRNFTGLNPAINLEDIPARIPMEPIEWKRGKKPRLAGVSSFGITGTDAHAILQETPELSHPGFIQPESPQSTPTPQQRPLQILTFSGKSEEALEDSLKQIKTFLESRPTEELRDVAYTGNVGRGSFPHRAVVVGRDVGDVLEKLKNGAHVLRKVVEEEGPRICFLFTGQGSQYPGMARDLYDSSLVFKLHFDQCDTTLRKVYGVDMKSVLWGENQSSLSRTIYSQTSIFCVEYCLLKLWASWGIFPDYVLGHSLGEFAAAVAAGILQFEDALTLVAERSRLIDALPGGKMLVLKENKDKTEVLLKKAFESKSNENTLDFAAINSEEQTVVAGCSEDILKFAEFCKNNGTKTHVLEATHAFHSRAMEPMMEEYGRVAGGIQYNKTNKKSCTFVSGMDGVPKEASSIDAQYWVRHTREPVRFASAAASLFQLGVSLFLEVGPQPVLSALTLVNAATAAPDAPILVLPSLRKQEEDWSTLLSSLGRLWLSGVGVDWRGFHQWDVAPPPRILPIPFYPFQNRTFWFDMPERGLGEIHPLLGTQLPNASSLKLYQNELRVENAEYLKDHMIGSKIIFPGAGFLELALVSGHSATTCTESTYSLPSGPITLENFVIESPLCLHEVDKTELQVIVSPSTEDAQGETKISIYSRLVLDKETQKWIRHASATFSPYAPAEVLEAGGAGEKLLRMLQTPGEQRELEEVYGKLAEYGLRFGPTFQTLRSILSSDQTENCTLFEVSLKAPVASSKYICHPVLLDSLFQAIMISSAPSADKLHVPVSVDKLVIYSLIPEQQQQQQLSSSLYILCTKEDSLVKASLLDSSGHLFAVMEGATLMETTVGAISSALEAQKLSLPNMYEDVWRVGGLGPLERRVELSTSLNPALFAPAPPEHRVRFNALSAEDELFLEKAEALYAYYMIKALWDLGFTRKDLEVVEVERAATTFKVLPGLLGFFRYIFLELEKDGYYRREEESLRFSLIRDLPTLQYLETTGIPSLYSTAHPLSPNEVDYVSSTGRQLAALLTGKESALPYLFPEDPSAPSAEAYYMEARLSCKAHLLIADYCGRLLNEEEPISGILRVLEVGAGTGSFTKTMVRVLQGPPSNWEYTYTDLSPVFFGKGQKIFEGSGKSGMRVHYRLLNIEEDPAAQGFLPFHYDIIVANNVIHACKDVRRACSVLRNLLRPGGSLIISESFAPYRGTVMTFGLLEAYWHYEDTELRGWATELPEDKWKMVLEETGFDRTASFPAFGDRFAIVSARAAAAGVAYALVKQVPPKVWFILKNEEVEELASFLQRSLTSFGHSVMMISKGEEFARKGSCEYIIRPYEEEDMVRLLTKEGHVLDGLIYLWGLLPSNGNQPNTTTSAVLDVTPSTRPFLHLCKAMISMDAPKLYVVTQGTLSVGDYDLATPTASPLYAMAKCFQNEAPSASTRVLDFEGPVLGESECAEVLAELFTQDQEIYVAYRGGQRIVPRFIPWKPPLAALSFPKSQRFHLVLPPSNAISDLRFGPLPVPTQALGEHEVEVRVKSYALNFRDIFAVLKPSAEFEKLNTVGIDWSGVVTALGSSVSKWKVGDAVFGTNLNGDALPSHFRWREELLLPIPQSMTFNEAATIPAVAATAYLSLIKVAKLGKEDTILIHTASGGVGLVAVQIAQSVGARIVATAGNKRKRAYLRGLGVEHVFHSRNTAYAEDIRKELGGRGVSVVLNSLTSAGFKEASLSVLEKGGRFVEMSKLNIWSAAEVAAVRPDVSYTVVDLSSSTEAEMMEHFGNIEEFLSNGTIRPIPYCRFDSSEIREAFNFLQKAKHIGKVVVRMPEAEQGHAIPLFSSRSTYIITGGLGGIGMEVAKWMVSSGARHIALVGRSAPSPKAVEELGRLNEGGAAHVFPLQYDVGVLEEASSLLRRLAQDPSLPPVRGIMHAAGVLSDAIFSNQSWPKYLTTYNPKVLGGWNLHHLTLSYPLEHFVMFSSAVASIGSMGQSNHSSANFFLDALAYYRHSLGLPATTINWGQWGQVGVAANIEIIGLRPFSALQGISALERVLKSQRLQTCVCDADFGLMKQVFSGVRKYYEELKLSKDGGDSLSTKDLILDNEKFWADYDAAKGEEERLELIRRFVRSMIRQILKLGKEEVFGDDEKFQDLGMDSLMMIEMKNVVQTTLGKRATITVNSVKDCHTVNELASRLAQLLSGNRVDEVPVPTREQLLSLIKEDSTLPEHIRHNPSLPPPLPIPELRVLLLTGVTGNMGPYFLRELSKLPQFTRIYCLVREDKEKGLEAGARLEKKLRGKGLLAQIDMGKVVVLPGNITAPLFSLSEEEYGRLSLEVDGIVHLAVKSNLTDEYKRIDAPDASDIRTVNVKGCLNVLEFATRGRTKVLFHASTIVANAGLGDDYSLSEEWPKENDFDEMPGTAYPISKYVCDRLMAQGVVERGLPIKVFRFPAVGGEAGSGANVDYENNQLMLRMMSYLRLGIMPALPLPFFILPVDTCVNLSLQVFLREDTPFEIYNVYNPHPVPETELVLIGEELGYKVEIVEPDEFQERLGQVKDSKLIHFLKEATENKDAQNRMLKDAPAIITAYTRNPTHAFVSKKLSRLIPSYPKEIESTLEVIKRDLAWAKSSGVFEKFGF